MKFRLIGAATLLYTSFLYAQSDGNYTRYPVVSSGTVTQINTGTGLTGGPITASGTISLVTPVTIANGGTGATSFTQGSVPFAGASSLSQDNANFFWDATNHKLGLGTTTPIARSESHASAFDAYLSLMTGATPTGRNLVLGWNNGVSYAVGISVPFSAFSPYNLILPPAQGAASTFLQNDGSGNLSWATVNGMAIGAPVTGGTSGSVLYVDASSHLAQDNANFFWDASNHRLGIGTTTPSQSLDISSARSVINVNSIGNGMNSGIQFQASSNASFPGIFDIPNAVLANAYFLFTADGSGSHLAIRHNGNIGINTILPDAKLEMRDGHQKSTQTTVPTAAPTSNAGTGATCTVSNATDSAGSINLTTTAVASSSGDVCDVTFNMAYNVAPICTFSPVDANAILDAVVQGVFVTTSTTALSINFANADAVGRSYSWAYNCLETQ